MARYVVVCGIETKNTVYNQHLNSILVITEGFVLATSKEARLFFLAFHVVGVLIVIK